MPDGGATFFATLGATLKTAAAALIIEAIGTAIIGKLFGGKEGQSGGIKDVVTNNVLPRRIIYGTREVGGQLVYLETNGGDENHWLHMIVAVSGHPVEDITWVKLNEEIIDISGEDGTNDLHGSGSFSIKDTATGNAGTEWGVSNGTTKAAWGKVIKVNGWADANTVYVPQTYKDNPSTAPTFVQNDIRRANYVSSWLSPQGTVNTDQIVNENQWETVGNPLWKRDTHTLTNCAYIYIRVRYNKDRPSQTRIPKMKFTVKGKKLYDPRKDSTSPVYNSALGSGHDIDDPTTWEWSETWALPVLDYLINTQYGLKMNTDFTGEDKEINWGTFAQAADDSDDMVAHGASSDLTNISLLSTYFPNWQPASGSNWELPRYTLNAVITTDQNPISIVEGMLNEGAGFLAYAQAEYFLYAGKYRAPASSNDILDENDLAGPINVSTANSRANTFNKVGGTYVRQYLDDAQVDFYPIYEPTDFGLVNPTESDGVTNPYEVEDGEEIIKEFDFPYCLYEPEAQRKARIYLERNRQALTVTAKFNLNALKYSVGDIVYLKIDRLGWGLDAQAADPLDSNYSGNAPKQFMILGATVNEDFTVDMTLREEASAIYDWNEGDAFLTDPSPNRTLNLIKRTDPVNPPSWETSSQPLDSTIISYADGSTNSKTTIKWLAPEIYNVSEGTGVGRNQIAGYELQYGIVTNAGAGSAVDRVTEWINYGASIPNDPEVDLQGPVDIYGLTNNAGERYEFRIRARTWYGRTSDWAYFMDSTFAPSDGNGYDVGIDTVAPTAPSALSCTDNLGSIIEATVTLPSGYPDTDVAFLELQSSSSVSNKDSAPVKTYRIATPIRDLSSLDSFSVTISPDNLDVYRYFWARFIDTSGNIGDWYPSGNGISGRAVTAAGASGEDGIAAFLTNDSYLAPADVDGNLLSGALSGASGSFKVFSGTTELSDPNVAYSGDATQNGLTINVNETTGAFSIVEESVGWSTDSETFEIVATLSSAYGSNQISKEFTVTKARQGSTGDTGDTGPAGQALRTVNMYNLNDNTIPDSTGGTFDTPISSANAADNWQLDVPGLSSDGDIVYVSSRLFTDDGNSPQESNWSTPSIYARRVDGDDGLVGPSGRDATVVAGVKINHSAFSTSDTGEMYIHGLDSSGDPADVDGSVVYNGSVITITKGAVLTGAASSTEVRGYIAYDTSGTNFTVNAAATNKAAVRYYYDKDNDEIKWQYDNNTTWVDFDSTNQIDNIIIIGAFYKAVGGDTSIGNATIIAPMPLSNLVIRAGQIETTALSALSATIGQVETRVDNGGVGNTTPRLVLQDNVSPLIIFATDDDTKLFELTDTGSEIEVRLKGDFGLHSLNTANAFSEAGIADLRGRLGLTAPTGGQGTGGTAELSAKVSLGSATSSYQYVTVPGSWDPAGSNDITLNYQVSDFASGSGLAPDNAGNWYFKWQYRLDGGSWTDVPSSENGPISGSYSEIVEEFFTRWSYVMSATRQTTWSPSNPSVIGAASLIEFRFAYRLASGSEYNAYVDSATVTEPIVGAGVLEEHTHTTDEITNLSSYTGLDSRYFTETEINNFFSGSVAKTGYNKSNWDTAYGWGNHATAGYITGNQTITLSGDASGSGSTSINVTVANDSHTHDTRYYTETEISNFFSGSVAKTGYNKSNWDTAYGWGNHATAGYITGNQTITLSGDASGSGSTSINVTVANDSHTHDTRYYTETEISNFFSGSVAKTGYNKSNWDTAYGWGNHASAGYALLSGATFTGDVSVNTTIKAIRIGTATGSQLAIGAGEAWSYMGSGNTGTGEILWLGAEQGIKIISSPDNFASDWAGRYEATLVNSAGNSYFPGNLYVGGDGIGRLEKVSGQYGSIQVDGNEGSSGGWAGVSIGGRHVLMDNGTTVGLYNDTNNEWMLQAVDNSYVRLFFNNSVALQTKSPSATGATSSAIVYDHSNTARDVGFNNLRRVVTNASFTLAAQHAGGLAFLTRAAASGYTITLEASTSTDFPVDSVLTVINTGGSGGTKTYVVSEGSGTTLYAVMGGTLTDSGGTSSIRPGSVATIYRYSATEYYIFGNGITA